MRILSVVGLKISSGQRATIIQSDSFTSQKRTIRSLFRFSKIFAVLAFTSTFVFLQVKDFPFAKSIQTQILNLTEPVTHYVAKPFLWIGEVTTYFSAQHNLIEQNERLRLQNEHLLRLNHQAKNHEQENTQLREALNVKNVVVDDITTARVTHHTFDGFSSQHYLSATKFDGVLKNNAVLATSGALIGRIVETGDKHSRLMTILEAGSNVPVQFENTHEQAVLKGTNSKTLNVIRVENPSHVKPGDRLVTSGIGGIFPAGIPVAVITSVDNGNIKAQANATINDLDFVLIVTSQLQN